MEKIAKHESLHNKISKFIYFHNNTNIEENELENIKKKCGKIELEVHGIEYLSKLLQQAYPEIAKVELGVKDDYETVSKVSNEEIERIAKKVHEEMRTNDAVETIKMHIYELYNSAASIINTSDAIVSISNKDKIKLKTIFDKLKAFEFCYDNKESEDTVLYYHNLFVILSKSSVEEGIEFYDAMPDFVKRNSKSLYMYTSLLIFKKRYIDAKSLLEEQYFEKNNVEFFDNLVRTYYLLEMYDKVVKLLSNKKKEEFDEYGFLATIYIFSKNKIKRYNEKELIKMNSGKFKKMPLFYSCTAYLLYSLDKRKKTYKMQFQKGVDLLDKENSFLISVMCDNSVNIGLQEIMIKYLLKIELTPLLESKMLELLSNISEYSIVPSDKIDELISKCDGLSFDKNYLIAKISESKGKEIEAIKFYKASFKKNKNIHALFRLVSLTIKNRVKLDENLIHELFNVNTYDSMMLSAEAYKYIGKYELSLASSYKAIYLSDSNSRKNNALCQFWTISMLFDKEEKKLEHIKENSVVVLENSKNNKLYILEDDDYFVPKNRILNATVIRTSSDIGIELLHKKVGDKIKIKNIEYCIKEVLHKYVYLCQIAFNIIKSKENTKMICSGENETEELLKELKKEMKNQQEYINERLDHYQENIDIPLSVLLTKEKSFEEYGKLINTLLFNKDRVLYSGEIIDVNLENGFVIDHTSLIVLSLFGALDIFDFVKGKIYITTSLYNKFSYFYEKMIKGHDDTEKYVYLVDDEKLVFNETPMLDKINFWKKLKKIVDGFIVEDYEFENDDLLNSRTIEILDKVQFDLLGLAREKNIPYICDDLIIRRICNKYNVVHTNSLKLVKEYSQNYLDYVEILKKYIACNYISTIDFNELTYVSGKLYKDFTDENKVVFLSIIEELLKNEISFKFYAPILVTRIKSLEKVQFLDIFGETYENLFSTFYINYVGKMLVDYNDILGLDFFNNVSE